MPTAEFLFNVLLLTLAAVAVLVSAIYLQYRESKKNHWPHPFIRVNRKLRVVENHERIQSFRVIQENIRYSKTEEHLRTVFELIERFRERYGRVKEYDELLSDYCSQSAMITG